MSERLYRRKVSLIISRVFFILMLILAGVGFICQWSYRNSPNKAIPMDDVRYVVGQKERKADRKIGEIEKLILQNHVDSLIWISFEKQPITYLVFDNDRLIFWSDNQIVPENLKNTTWQYTLLSNVHAITRSKQVDGYNIVAYIPIKYNYPYENDDLQNGYVNGLKLNKEVDIVLNSPASKYAVFNHQKQYMFSLEPSEHPIYNERWAVAAMLFFLASFLILFYLFARFPLLLGRTSITWTEYLTVSLVMAVFVFGSLWFNFPAAFFQNKIFTPFHYASNSFLATLTHLSFLTAFLYSLIHLYSFYVKKIVINHKYFRLIRVFLLLISGLYFILIFNFLVGIVFNSSTEINILKLDNITWVSVWNHFLLLVLGLSFMLLHIKVHRTLLQKGNLKEILALDIFVILIIGIISYFMLGKYSFIAIFTYSALSVVLYLPHVFPKLMNNVWYVAVWLLPFTLFVTLSSIYMNKDKKFDKYRILTENHYLNEDTEDDRIAVTMLDDLNRELLNDKRLLHLVQFPDSIQRANEYINNMYLRGFWNKYEMTLFATFPHSEVDKKYSDNIDLWARKVKNTNFYLYNNPNSDISILGAFYNIGNSDKKVNYFMEFKPKMYHRSYSFPNLLREEPPSIQSQLSLSTARYTFRELVAPTGKFKYLPDANWISKNNKNYFVQKYNGYTHYIYAPNIYNYYIISEKNNQMWTFVLYFLYVFLFYMCIYFFVVWLHNVTHKSAKKYNNFTSRFIYSFVILLVVSFVSIFYVSLDNIQQKYVQEQKNTLEKTKNYIQSALQEKYSWREKLDSTVTSDLNFELQDLSYIFQTDINVYDDNGKLIASSQPTLFTRKLISKQMSPLPYFSKNETLNLYEHIGKLEYLTAYTDFYNMDFLPIGFIAVPQFLSRDQLKADLESFLAVIVHIYLTIIILFVILSLIIGKQLSAPLAMLQERLKQIKLGQINKKIDYKPKDEIGQLVEQYNTTVDELEKSARLLAKSERESAWKSMARQVAHEINNPLTPMKLTIQQLQRTKAMNDKRFDEYFEKSTSTLIEQIENLSKIAGTFSNFAKLPEAKFVKVDVAKKILSVTVLFAHSHEDISITYHGTSSDVYALADREQLIQVFNNLLKNAVQAIPAQRDGKIEVRLETTDKQIFVYVKDNGKGIPDDVKDKLFTPNFTTKSTGMGLGLSISRNIVQIAGGEITFDTEENIGTEFKVTLPRVER